MILVLFR